MDLLLYSHYNFLKINKHRNLKMLSKKRQLELKHNMLLFMCRYNISFSPLSFRMKIINTGIIILMYFVDTKHKRLGLKINGMWVFCLFCFDLFS